MIRDMYASVFVQTSWPRTSGDDPWVDYLRKPDNTLAPHERG